MNARPRLRPSLVGCSALVLYAVWIAMTGPTLDQVTGACEASRDVERAFDPLVSTIPIAIAMASAEDERRAVVTPEARDAQDDESAVTIESSRVLVLVLDGQSRPVAGVGIDLIVDPSSDERDDPCELAIDPNSGCSFGASNPDLLGYAPATDECGVVDLASSPGKRVRACVTRLNGVLLSLESPLRQCMSAIVEVLPGDSTSVTLVLEDVNGTGGNARAVDR